MELLVVVCLDLGPHNPDLRSVFPLGLFRTTTMDFRAHLYRQATIGLSWNGIWLLLELAPDYGPDHHHVWTLYALGLLPAQTVADQ